MRHHTRQHAPRHRRVRRSRHYSQEKADQHPLETQHRAESRRRSGYVTPPLSLSQRANATPKASSVGHGGHRDVLVAGHSGKMHSGPTSRPAPRRRPRKREGVKHDLATDAAHPPRQRSRKHGHPRHRSVRGTDSAIVSSRRTAGLLEGSGTSVMDARSMHTAYSSLPPNRNEDADDAMLAAMEQPRTNRTRNLSLIHI